MSLSTVHAFSSCPLGEDPQHCAADSFGRVRGFRNLYIADASLIPDSPGVNPQGTVMALALRNARAFLAHAEEKKEL
jgi:choline dehydrogenase-like flavoprotein